ncbi:hypothetical protein AAZX31_20G129000 [Glycine max]|uniref:Ubiquitin-like domain-containing protein n=1 Tax=Glycine max TaxID=3847 RepID=K7N3E7_SOYBN|nr:uncharacterized protein LOC102667035 [Glycine max]KAG4910349.1 hypothetical protein JHK87_056465 [Glycine soja]KAH1190925.1 hypothetical protein GmHk_20G058346 [Glycine max]|eukprot:XP_006606901.1 uncharacterized protein LOC102667035 [Glycine max]
MDLSLVMENDKTLCMEVGFFDSFQEIKEKIEKFTGIPTYRQTLLFNGQVLRNEAIIFNTDISEASRVHFLLDADFGNHHDEITDMHIPSGEELEELMRWNPDGSVTPMTVTENALPPRNPEFTPSPPPPLHETEITPGGSVSDERNPKE